MVLFCSATIRTLIMFIFVIDHFLNVFAPYKYLQHKAKITISLSVASWIFSVGVTVILFPGILDCYTFEPFVWVCSVSGECSYYCFIYTSVLFTLFLTPVTILPVFFYIALYIKAKKVMKILPRTDAAENFRREWKATVTFFLLFITVFGLHFPAILIQITITSIYPIVTESPPSVHSLHLQLGVGISSRCH